MIELKSGSCCITLQAKINMPSGMDDYLIWLKDNGAPIIGYTILKVAPGYIISLSEDTSNGSTHVTWSPLNEST